MAKKINTQNSEPIANCSQLATGVIENRSLRQAVRRNIDKFPDDFLFRLNREEANKLIINGVSQNVIPSGYNTGGADMWYGVFHSYIGGSDWDDDNAIETSEIAKHNAQYPAIDVKEFTKPLDRFLYAGNGPRTPALTIIIRSRSGVGVLVLRTLAARGHMNGRGPQA